MSHLILDWFFYGSEGVQSIGRARTPKHMLFGNFLSVLSALKANVEKENHIKKNLKFSLKIKFQNLNFGHGQ